MMDFRCRAQIAEILGDVNRWYCSQYHRREVSTKEDNLLAEYFVRSGGARDFDRRYREAMSMENRWFCSQRHQRDVREQEILWKYYLSSATSTRRIA